MIVYKNRFFKIALNNSYYELIPNNREVIILPIVDKKYFLVIRAIRKILKKTLYEFPAGSFNLNEKPINAAKREFSEETGIKLLKINKFIRMNDIYQIPNRTKNTVYVYAVHISMSQIDKKFKSDEIYSLEVLSLKKIFSLIKNGKFNTSVPIAILLQYLLGKKINEKQFRL
jgi:ADP-ribose pyrophosphatase